MTIGYLLQIYLGLQFIIFGINGFKSFLPLPPQTEQMKQVVGVFYQIPYFMNFIKIFEILAGLALIFSFHVFLFKLLLLPLVFMIFFLQWTLNRQYSLMITLQLLLPYLLSLYLDNQLFIQLLRIVTV